MLQVFPRSFIHKSLRMVAAKRNRSPMATLRSLPKAGIIHLRVISHFRSYHSAHATLHLQKDTDYETVKPTLVEMVEKTTVPVWQNPLHHNNPEMKKMFHEDFQAGEEMVPTPLPPFETDADKVVAPPHIHDLAQRIVNLTLLELKELTEKIAVHFDFDDQVMASSYFGGAAAAATATLPQEDQQEKKVIFDLKLVGFDSKAKIKVIKEIRAIAGLGLKEAKELVEAAPKVFQKDLKQDRAEELKAQLEAVGAQVEIV